MTVKEESVEFQLTMSFFNFIANTISLINQGILSCNPKELSLDALGIAYVGLLYSNEKGIFEMPVEEMIDVLERECGVPLLVFETTAKTNLVDIAEQMGLEVIS